MPTPRIVIDFSGASPIFRISKPGRSAYSANPADLILTEDALTYHPFVQGSHTFAGNGTFNVALSGFDDPPFIILKSSDNTMPATRNYYATVANDLTLFTLRNSANIARTITYFIFGNTV